LFVVKNLAIILNAEPIIMEMLGVN